VELKKGVTVPEIAREAGRLVQLLAEGASAGWLFGSVVNGGLRPDSDVDVLVVVDEPLSEESRRAIVARLLTLSGEPGNDQGLRPLELTIVQRDNLIPWRYPPVSELVYGEWRRQDFLRGRIAGPAADPDLAIVLHQIRQCSLTLWGDDADWVIPPVPLSDIRRAIGDALPGVLAGVEGDERNVLLTLARMWLTLETGEIAPKDVAAAWAVQRLTPEQGDLLSLARLGYLGEVQDNWRNNDSQVATLVRLLSAKIETCLA
jgi:aminoglycoside 9-adenylyltransferase